MTPLRMQTITQEVPSFRYHFVRLPIESLVTTSDSVGVRLDDGNLL